MLNATEARALIERLYAGFTMATDRTDINVIAATGAAEDIARSGGLPAVLAAIVAEAVAMERYMERCRIIFIIEEAFDCKHIEDEPCSCAACVVRRRVMAEDAAMPTAPEDGRPQ